MTRGIFITGTGTGVGKTIAAAAILRAARAAGIDAVPFKPVQTGAVDGPDGLRSPDVEFCLAAAGLRPKPDEAALMAPLLYKPACSPHLAGRIEGRPVDLDTIRCCAETLLARHDAVIVEGAGGVMVPLNDSATMLDLMAALGLPVLVVAINGLGTINHTLLTLAALRQAGIEVLGVVLNQPDPPAGLRPPRGADEFIRRDNPETIARFGGATVLGCLPHAGDLAAGNVAGWARVEAGFMGMAEIQKRLKSK
jgi:dethiobiotin synthetase